MTTEHPAHLRRTVEIGRLRLDHKHWANPRTFTGLDEDSLDEFGKNLKHEGIQVPLHVVRVKTINGDSADLVLDGQRRVRAGLRVFPKTHPVEVIDMEPEPIEMTPVKSAELLRRILNIGNRSGLSSYELSEAAESLKRDDETMSLASIARSLNKSESWVSKMLTARKNATPKLMLSWRKGEITDEQFKELAAEKPAEQTKITEAVVEARKSDDKVSARTLVKEIAEKKKTERLAVKQAAKDAKAAAKQAELDAKQAAKDAKKAAKEAARVVSGEQQDLFAKKAREAAEAKEEAKAAKEAKKDDAPKAPTRAALEDLVAIGQKKPPTHDYVKGVMAGVSFALGFTTPDKFGSPWITYLARVEGRAKAKKAKPTPKAKRPAAAKAKRPAKGKKAKR